MSDNEATEGKVSAWTDEARYQFALRALAQFVEDGKKINWTRLTMPGRTTKSLQNQWTKVNKQIQDINSEWADAAQSPAKTPVKKTAPRKRAPPKSKVTVDPEDDEEEAEQTPKKASPRKRGSVGASTPSKKAKVKNEEEGDPSTVKAEHEDLDEDQA